MADEVEVFLEAAFFAAEAFVALPAGRPRFPAVAVFIGVVDFFGVVLVVFFCTPAAFDFVAAAALVVVVRFFEVLAFAGDLAVLVMVGFGVLRGRSLAGILPVILKIDVLLLS